jgi:hypothetical protein
MYDNVDLALHKTDCPGVDFLKDIPQFLSSEISHGVSQYGYYFNGYLDSLKVSINASRIKISDSSLCKYYHGDNFKTISRKDTARAIEKISDSLCIPFHLAKVFRIDFSTNLIMKHNAEIYYPFLGEAKYYTRLPQNNGLYYNNQKRQLLFYGKEYEQKIKGNPIPELYQNKHTLRFEMRLRKRLREQLKEQELTAGLLSDERFYKKLVKRWRDEYLAIQKIHSNSLIMKPTGKRKDFIENLALLSILEHGQTDILDRIKEWQESGEITKKQAYDLRNAVKELSKKKINDRGNEYINELDKKIKEAARFS